MYKPSKISSQLYLIFRTGMQFSIKSIYAVKWLKTYVFFPHIFLIRFRKKSFNIRNLQW